MPLAGMDWQLTGHFQGARAAGGKTGLSAVVTAIMFIIAIIFAPIFLAIPSFATTPAMLYVGLLMLSSIKKVDFGGDAADTIGAFLAIIMMPLTYSISNGILIGMITYVLMNVICGNFKKITPVMYILTVLFILKFTFIF